MRRISAILLCFIAAAAMFTGCGLIKPDYSFEKVVCEYSWGGGFGTVLDTKTTTVTVYADNRVAVSSSGYTAEITITDEQRQAIIEIINANRVWEIGDISNNDVLDAGSQYLSLFDANGQEVYTCGGYATDNLSAKGKRFSDTASAICGMVHREVFVEVSHEADKLLMGIYN